MFRNSSISSVNAWKCVPRRRTVFVALVLALVIGNVGQIPGAQAAPAAAELRYSMSARKLKGNNTTICVGDDVPIHVRVTRAEFIGNQGDNVQDISGARIEASMSNEGIGKLNPISIDTGWDSNDPGGADYKFHAEKVGTTIISFKGTINHVWWPAQLGLSPLVDRRDFVKDQVEITVEECEYKIIAISHFSAQGVKLVATLEGGMKKDAEGHFTGIATVTWVGENISTGDCSSVISIASKEVELNGQLDDDQLIVDVNYPAMTLTNIGKCENAEASLPLNQQAEVTPDPVTVTIPASGGGKRETQNLQEPTYYAMQGFVVIVVTRVNKP